MQLSTRVESHPTVVSPGVMLSHPKTCPGTFWYTQKRLPATPLDKRLLTQSLQVKPARLQQVSYHTQQTQKETFNWGKLQIPMCGTALDVVQVQTPTCAPLPQHGCAHGYSCVIIYSYTHTHLKTFQSCFFFTYTLGRTYFNNSWCRGSCPTVHQAWTDNKWWNQAAFLAPLATHARYRWHCYHTLSADTERQTLLYLYFNFRSW